MFPFSQYTPAEHLGLLVLMVLRQAAAPEQANSAASGYLVVQAFWERRAFAPTTPQVPPAVPATMRRHLVEL